MDMEAALAWRLMLAGKDRTETKRFLLRQGDEALLAFDDHWFSKAHDGQLPPAEPWRTWLLIAGRGFGKTRAGAEYVSARAQADGDLRIALVGATAGDVERVMVRGKSGLFEVAAAEEELVFYPSRGLVEFSSGAQAFVYSGANPDGLRGPEHHLAWCDELAKWAYPQRTWDNLLLGLRLGERPKALVTTTPRPIPLLRRLAAAADTGATGGRMTDNRYLPADFVAAMTGRYAGTRFGRQELDGELIADAPGALWTRDLVDRCRADLQVSAPPQAGEGAAVRVVVGVDPPASAEGDACGIVVCAMDAGDVAWVIEDATVAGCSPEGWARAVVAAAARWGADLVVAEANQGGDMVASVLRQVDPALPVRPVKARYGKGQRAEPVALLFEQGRARFAGVFPELEDELCGLIRGGSYEGPGRSPDRADAMVWALAELTQTKRGEPRVLGL